MSEVLQGEDESDIENTNYPGVTVLTKVVDFEGNNRKISTITPKYVKLLSTTELDLLNTIPINADSPELRNNLYTDASPVQATSSLSSFPHLASFIFEVEPPSNLKKVDYDNLYLLMDSDMVSNKNMDTKITNTEWRIFSGKPAPKPRKAPVFSV